MLLNPISSKLPVAGSTGHQDLAGRGRIRVYVGPSPLFVVLSHVACRLVKIGGGRCLLATTRAHDG